MERRSFLASGLAGLAGAAGLAVPAARAALPEEEPPQAAGGPPVVFWVPHADDETLSMGLDLCAELAGGRAAVVVLVTRAASPSMLALLNGEAPDPVSDTRHDPVLESYLGPLVDGRLTPDAVAEAREREFRSACGVYNAFGGGRLSAVVHRPLEAVTVEGVRQLVLDVAARHPGAAHRTMSWTDPHPDHAACGRALRELRAEGAVDDVRWYVKRGAEDATVAERLRLRPVDAVAGAADAVRRAAECYRGWNPAAGAYGFGYRSVPASFEALAAQPQCLAHG
ncbi:PIG-L family deacetylase [Quadrisphaera sp. DSM 44207]|uniref:PIG-L family deacetylase n=1 Tax=Quadrisphaera sp. DSM 44207 TaxID=1881057 RepID=UPI0008823792|nr:PIG-L family deacetylase [Quadrisphaera sp. DSM 44207]SDQ10750.1 GlcNAc-PI de-N-acetylase [Quadrisphaera sp. DSM 44207]